MNKRLKKSGRNSKETFGLVLAIETSCDDTSVALVDKEGRVIGMKSQNQDDVHSPFGGVIPELACRNHTMRLLPLLDSLIEETKTEWKNIDGIAVTCKPGLIGALLVGVTVAKTLASLHDIPLIGVNHLEGHLHAAFLTDGTYSPSSDFIYPFVGLCVSGGHTSLYEVKGLGKYSLLGRTLDDAAGEAFDKFGKLLGLGYPAGAKVDQRAKGGNKTAFGFPRALLKKGDLNFSFSGLKTAGSLEIQKLTARQEPDEKTIQDLCASYQEAIVDVLIEKTQRALKATGLKRVVITGGVSANSRLREAALSAFAEVLIPPLRFCTDNAAMIGFVGMKRFSRGEKSPLDSHPRGFYESVGAGLMHSKKELEDRIASSGIRPLKSLGQNFLMNPKICAEILHSVQNLKPQTVVEIGPGLGALTDDLKQGPWKTILIELDSGLVEYWKKLAPAVQIIHQDALQVDWKKLSMDEPAILVSNLPYSIAASLVVELSSIAQKPFQALLLMFQKEVAMRIEAAPHDEDYGMLSVIAQVRWKIEKVIDAGPQDFFPVPHVGSRALLFTPKDVHVSLSDFLIFVKLAFSQRRKKLASNLGANYPKEQIPPMLESLKLGPDVRAQELSPAQFLDLFSLLRSKKR